MRKKVLVVLAMVFALTAAVATPASADWALRGDEEIKLYLVECPNEDAPGPLVTWIGAVDFGKKTLGKAYFPTADLLEFAEGFVYFEEVWTLFWLPRGKLTEEKLIKAACNPRRVVLEGWDEGIGTPWGTAFAVGEVTWGRKHMRKFVGGDTMWTGAYANEAGDEFASTFYIHKP